LLFLLWFYRCCRHGLPGLAMLIEFAVGGCLRRHDGRLRRRVTRLYLNRELVNPSCPGANLLSSFRIAYSGG
jgi:hypothetical protein